jgi:hypothetical protein
MGRSRAGLVRWTSERGVERREGGNARRRGAPVQSPSGCAIHDTPPLQTTERLAGTTRSSSGPGHCSVQRLMKHRIARLGFLGVLLFAGLVACSGRIGTLASVAGNDAANADFGSAPVGDDLATSADLAGDESGIAVPEAGGAGGMAIDPQESLSATPPAAAMMAAPVTTAAAPTPPDGLPGPSQNSSGGGGGKVHGQDHGRGPRDAG